MAQGYWDIHNHILPGVDDGAFFIEETVQLIESEYVQGIRNVIFTPHYRRGMFEVPAEERKKVFLNTADLLKAQFPDMKFYLGCEYHADIGSMPEQIETGNQMPGKQTVLAEFKRDTSFLTIRGIVIKLLEQGYCPIIAHPERYHCLCGELECVEELKKLGAKLQVNAGSVLGNSGRMSKKVSSWMLKNNLVDFVASDAHDLQERPVEMEGCRILIAQKYGTKLAEQVFRENAEQLFGNDEE